MSSHAIEHVKPMSQVELLVDDLKRFAPESELLPMQAGEVEFTTLLSEQTRHSIRGIAILLPDMAISPVQASAFLRLRYQLNEYGWVTLAGLMPDLTQGEAVADNEEIANLFSKRPDSSAHYFSDTWQAQYRNQLKLYVEAMAQQTKNFPGLILYVAQGATAGWLVEALDKQEIKSPDALVLISPYLPDTPLNRALPAKIAQLNLPILDVWSEQDNRLALATVPERVNAAHRFLTVHYRQRELFGMLGLESREARLSKEIYGYLTYLGW